MRFEVGDIIVCNEDLLIGRDYDKNVKGFLGKVIYADAGRFVVEFYKYMNGHSGNGFGMSGKDGYCWIAGQNNRIFNKIKTNKKKRKSFTAKFGIFSNLIYAC